MTFLRRISRDTWLGVGLLFGMVALATLSAAQSVRPPVIPLDSTSNAPNGARALRLWVAALDYPLEEPQHNWFTVPATTYLMFMLEPSTTVTEGEWKVIEAWVRMGGQLIVAGDAAGTQSALTYWGYQLEPLWVVTTTVEQQVPLFNAPPLTTTVTGRPQAYLVPIADARNAPEQVVTHFSVGDAPVLVSFKHGRGQVVLSSMPYVFTNRGLTEPGNGALVLNLLTTQRHQRVWFDEWHHGQSPAAQPGLESWLTRSPMGQALVFVALTLFGALLLQGQRFGRAVPVVQAVAQRGPLDYVVAIANLHRRAGHRAETLRHYHQTLKRHLGQRYRLLPSLPDADYVNQLVAYQPATDGAALLTLLTQLQQPQVSEAELLRLARVAAEWMAAAQ